MNNEVTETIALNRKFEAKYFPKVRAAIQSQVNTIIRAVEYYGDVQHGINAANNIISTPAGKVIDRLYQEVGLRYARKTWRSLTEQKRSARKPKGVKGIEKNLPYLKMSFKGFGFNADWVEFIKKTLSKYLLAKTFEIAETTRESLLKVLQKSVEEGWGVEKTVQALKDLPLPRTQAARIVRTEVTRASNTGAMAAGDTFEFEQTKKWIAARDVRTRGTNPEDHASHVRLNGVTIDYDDVFIDPVNKDSLRFPGDPEASAASTINCRCVVSVVAKMDERGLLIPKKNQVAA